LAEMFKIKKHGDTAQP